MLWPYNAVLKIPCIANKSHESQRETAREREREEGFFLSSVKYRVVKVEYQVKTVEYRVELVEYRVKIVEYRVPIVEYQVELVEY